MRALLAFCSSYKIDGFRAALSISLNVHAQNVAPKLASAIYKAFERSGAAPDVVSRAEQGAVFAAHAHQRPSVFNVVSCYQRGVGKRKASDKRSGGDARPPPSS